MAFQLGDDDVRSMDEMNLIPLIDIMLVLMIIFLLTATVLNPTVPLDLPETSAALNETPPRVRIQRYSYVQIKKVSTIRSLKS
jgi:biopolymer transport protein ExbD